MCFYPCQPSEPLGHPCQRVFRDPAPPYFHVQYAEFKATVEIRSLTISSGSLPRRAQELVLDWAELHQQELLEDWRPCMEKQQPNPIAPLK
ncbi:MAG: DUF4160 domain-containing protein [Undibacterium sp.]|uniref:DUF4160 domain-containing protein n=1 Tax=Undibacterium sp. TaxID=1914977 RepID=UPI002724DEB3|nr:DUF4160 domain-containing protein [Undibacterium sp.]MDO8651685.1 DUF4160 domain-containing protein [Undibacterium sp.]